MYIAKEYVTALGEICNAEEALRATLERNPTDEEIIAYLNVYGVLDYDAKLVSAVRELRRARII